MRILYVDDERPNLLRFTNMFENKYEMFAARTGEEGLVLLEREGRWPCR